MIDLDFVQSLIQALDDSSLDSVEIEREGTRIRLAKTPDGMVAGPAAYAVPQAVPAAAMPAPAVVGEAAPDEQAEAAAPVRSDLKEITSPMVGTFYRSPAPDAPSYVEVGGRINAGDTLCILEAMKLMNELEAEISGTIEEICVENAEPVEYGQVLFRVSP
jgi:acetyl-CoA carboxylase biotin carboxyl carrier protein